QPLPVGATYTTSLTVTLSPSAKGLYFVVIANDSVSTPPPFTIPGLIPPPPPTEQFTPLKEVDTTNDSRAQATVVTPGPANLKITNIQIPSGNFSGEPMTFSYTVTNVGQFPVWTGTQSWRDFLW